MSEKEKQEIYALFDANPNLSLQRLSEITGYTVAVLKKILMPGFNNKR